MERKEYLPNLPLATGIIKRPQLNKLFSDILKSPLSTITAAPGFGKTTMLANYLSKLADSVVWISLSNLDNDSTFFWKHFAIAASYEQPSLEKSIKAACFPESIEKMSEFVSLFAEYCHEDKVNNQIIVVYDNYERIHNEQVLNFINQMPAINTLYTTVKVHQVIIADELLPNLALRTSQPLFEGVNGRQNITTNDLCFTKDEILQLFQVHNIILDSSGTAQLMDKTGGWPFYLYLLANDKSKNFTNTYEAIYRLFDNNFFANYAVGMQNILLELSICRRLSTSTLSNLISKYSVDEAESEANRELIRKNPFLEFSLQKKIFSIMTAYHSFLTSKITMLNDEKKIPIFDTALDFAFEYNDFINVVDPYFRTKNYDGLMRCLTVIAPYKWSERDCQKILHYLNKIPDAYKKQNPWTDYFKSVAYFKNCKFEQSEVILKKLLTQLDEKNEQQQQLIGECYCALAIDSMFMNKRFDLSLFDKIIAYLPSGSILMNQKTFGIAENSFFYLPLDEQISFDEMIDYTYKFITKLTKVSNGCCTGYDYLFEAEGNLYQGNIKRAVHCANQAIFKAHTEDQLDIVLNGYNVLIRAAFFTGNYSLVVKHIKAMDKYYSQHDYSTLADLMDMFQTFYAFEFRDVSHVPEWIKNTDLKRYKRKVQNQGRNILICAIYAVKMEDYSRFHTLINELQAALDTSGMWLLRVMTNLLYAIFYAHEKNTGKALDYFYQCYSMVYASNLYYPLIMLKERLMPLLKLVENSKDKRFDQKWIHELEYKDREFLQNLETIANERELAGHVSDTHQYAKLTKRETQVLKLLANGLSRSEIAANLNISVSGVQKFLSNIYLKLGAKNGTDAVSIAYSLKII